MPKDRESLKYKIWRMVASTPFEFFIMLLIVLNTLLLMMKVGQYFYIVGSTFPYNEHPMRTSRGRVE